MFVHKLWTSGGILMHSIHKDWSDKGLCRPQPVDGRFFTPIIGDLTTRISSKFNFIHTFNFRYPQVMHKVCVNYTDVIPQGFGMISGMS